MSTPLILGIDGGGTVTTTWLAEADGRVRGRGLSGPSNVKAVGVNAARTALDLSILAAFRAAGMEPREVEVSCLGLSGFDRPEDRDWLRAWAGETSLSRRLILVNDGDLVVAAGTADGWGIGLISGTGSIAVGIAPDGRRARSGGWGYVFGDEGSGYSVAVAALRLIARRHDGREPNGGGRDPLTRRICEELGIDSGDDLIRAIYANGFDRARISRLAPAVVRASADEPDLVDRLLRPAGRDLAEIVSAVALQLGWDGGPLPLAMAGGFLLNSPATADALLQALGSAGFEATTRAVVTPVDGALLLARRALIA